MKSKKCRLCGEAKPLDQFNGCALAKDGKAGNCKVCQATARAEKKTAKAPQPDSAIEPDAGPTLKRGGSLGFSAQQRDGDIVLEQESGEGIATIWLSRHELVELGTWAAGLEWK